METISSLGRDGPSMMKWCTPAELRVRPCTSVVVDWTLLVRGGCGMGTSGMRVTSS